jgi:hypothetical protein
MRVITAAALTLLLFALAACSRPTWKEYDYPAWGFAVSFKGQPSVTDSPASAKGPRSFQVELVQNGVDLVVEAIDASNSDKSDQQLLANIPDEMVQSSEGTVTSSANVAIGNVIGRDITIDRGRDPTERARVFVVNRRVYQVITQSPQGSDQSDVVPFLNSFHLLGK